MLSPLLLIDIKLVFNYNTIILAAKDATAGIKRQIKVKEITYEICNIWSWVTGNST